MSDFKFNCPHCQQSLEAPHDMMGTVIDCPSCNGRIEFPAPQSEPSAGSGRNVAVSVAACSVALIVIAAIAIVLFNQRTTKQPEQIPLSVKESSPVSSQPTIKTAVPPPANPTGKSPRDGYTPLNVMHVLNGDAGFVLPEFQQRVSRLQETVESEGQADTIVFPGVFSYSMQTVTNKLGKEDRFTEEPLPGLESGATHQPIKGPFLWYGRVGLGFLIIADGEGNQTTALSGLRYLPKAVAGGDAALKIVNDPEMEKWKKTFLSLRSFADAGSPGAIDIANSDARDTTAPGPSIQYIQKKYGPADRSEVKRSQISGVERIYYWYGPLGLIVSQKDNQIYGFAGTPPKMTVGKQPVTQIEGDAIKSSGKFQQ